MPARAGAFSTCSMGASWPSRIWNRTGPSRRGSSVFKSVTCVTNFVGVPATTSRCSAKISWRSPKTLICAVLASPPWPWSPASAVCPCREQPFNTPRIAPATRRLAHRCIQIIFISTKLSSRSRKLPNRAAAEAHDAAVKLREGENRQAKPNSPDAEASPGRTVRKAGKARGREVPRGRGIARNEEAPAVKVPRNRTPAAGGGSARHPPTAPPGRQISEPAPSARTSAP